MSQVNEILGLAMDIGELMLKSGAEVWRVEDTISRICTAYGCVHTDVFSITSLIIATTKKDGEYASQSRRVYTYESNLKKVEDLNELSRNICATKPSLSQVDLRIKEILSNDSIKTGRRLAAHLIVSFSFAIFFGGSIRDGFAAMLVAMLIFLLDIFLNRGRINRLAYTLVCSFMAGVMAVALAKAGLATHIDKVIIGNVMLLIPGIALTNGIRDILCGDIVTGLLRLCESILIAVSIAIGFAIPLIIMGGV